MGSLNRTLFLRVPIPMNLRLISTSARLNTEEQLFSNLFLHQIAGPKKSHSSMLGDKNVIYALHTHNIRPDGMEKYLSNYKTSVEFLHAQKADLGCDLVGSWTVSVGDMDQALHLWRHDGGFQNIDKAKTLFKNKADYLVLQKERGQLLRSRHLQYLIAFTFWPNAAPRQPSNIYEIRSYTLKPGTMIEWGNNWTRGLVHRCSQNEAFAGYFSQVGRLYNVHHIWCYKDLQTRRETREKAWEVPGWDDCIVNTVPLISITHSRILEPTEFSPTQ